MPVVQEQPLEENHDEEKKKAQRAGREHQGKEVVGLKLAVRVGDGVAETALPYRV